MTARTRKPAPTVRGEIENVLFAEGARVAATAQYIARETGLPLKAVQTELETMRLAGLLTTRTPKCGSVLYKSRDQYHDKWAAFGGPALTR